MVTLYRLFFRGSPPRVRGTVTEEEEVTDQGRITPACAGNRESVRVHTYNQQDHPRVCGEQSFTHTARTKSPGSPPRVRGTVVYIHNLYETPRITPACAGNSTVANT